MYESLKYKMKIKNEDRLAIWGFYYNWQHIFNIMSTANFNNTTPESKQLQTINVQ